MEIIEQIEYRGFYINVHPDDYPLDPRRDWDNLGTMVCFARNYNLGDKHDFSDPDEFQEWAKTADIISMPIYLLDHSGLKMNTYGFGCPWDSGQVGWIYVEKAKARKKYGWKRLSRQRIEKIKGYLENEVKIYDQYLSGEVYGYTIEPKKAN